MNNLKTLRESNKMTLREVGELANMPHSLVSEIENGRRKMSPRHASLLAPIFGVTEVYLMGDDAIRLDIPVADFMKDTLCGCFLKHEIRTILSRLNSSCLTRAVKFVIMVAKSNTRPYISLVLRFYLKLE